MKHVFRSSAECAHAWAHQTVPWGRSANTSFNGNTFNSYSTPIAVKLNWRGRDVYVIDTTGYSSTTSGHQSEAAMAVPLNADKWLVNCDSRRGYGVGIRTPADLVQAYLRLWNKPEEGCRAHTKAADFLYRIKYLEQAYDVAKKYRVKGAAKLARELESLSAKKLECMDIVQKHRQVQDERRDALREKRHEKYRIEKEQAIQTWATAMSGDITQLTDGELYVPWFINNGSHPHLIEKIDAEQKRRAALTVEDWLRGEPARLPYGSPILLRVTKDGQIQTSRNAFVPYEEGRLAFKFAMSKRETGWRRNGHTFKIGDFQLDSVGEHGVVIGCHDIKWSEIERFAKQEGWM